MKKNEKISISPFKVIFTQKKDFGVKNESGENIIESEEKTLHFPDGLEVEISTDCEGCIPERKIPFMGPFGSSPVGKA